MFDFLKDLDSKIEAAKPHFHRGLTKADAYACRIIGLLEEIASDDAPPEDQRVKRVALVNGVAQEFETPPGENWAMVALIVEPAGATTIRMSLGGVTRFAKQFAAADTPQIPAVVVSGGSTFTLLSSGADATVTVIAKLKRPRPKITRGITGDQLSGGTPTANEYEVERHYTDEAVHIQDPARAQNESEEQAMLANAAPEPDIYANAEPIP